MCIRNVKINGVRDPVGYQFDALILSYEMDGAPTQEPIVQIATDRARSHVV